MARKLTIEEALDYCLLNPDGLSDEQLLDTFPQYRAQIQPLLTLGQRVRTVDIPPVPVERRAAIQQRIIDRAPISGVHRNGTAASQRFVIAPPRTATAVPSIRTSLSRLARPLWALGAAAAILVIFVWWSAASALADSPFYDIKLTTENTLLNLQSDPVSRVRSHASLAEERLHDVRVMAEKGTIGEAGKAFVNFDYHINSNLTTLTQVQSGERVEIARVLLVSSEEGNRVMSDLNDSPALPPSIADDVERALYDTTTATSLASGVLADAGIDPASVPTPVVQAIVLATPSGSPPPSETRRATSVAGRAGSSATAQASHVVSRPTSVAASTHTPGPVALQTGVTHPTGTGVGGTVSDSTATTTLGAASTPTLVNILPGATLTLRPVYATSTPVSQPTSTSYVAYDTFTPTRIVLPPTSSPTNVWLPPVPTSTPAPPEYTWTPEPPERTHTPTDTPTWTDTSTPEPPTGTPVPPTPEGCLLSIVTVDASCESATCVTWTADVDNAGLDGVSGTWTAQLQVKARSGQWSTVGTQRGSVTFTPGATSLGGSVCGTMPTDVTGVRIWFTVTSSSPSCNVRGSSGTFETCNQAGTPTPGPMTTPTPRPTNTPRPTPTPRPTHTSHP